MKLLERKFLFLLDLSLFLLLLGGFTKELPE